MKVKKKQYICIIVIAALILLVLGGKYLLENRLTAVSIKQDSNTSADADAFKSVTEAEICLENEQVVFTMDANTTHFTVMNKNTGKSYRSTANLEGQDGVSALYSSEIAIDYYDSDSTLATMYSSGHSVVFDKFEIKASEDAIRVYYDICESQEEVFVPTVFTKEVFEEEILGNLGAGPKRRIVRYYKLYNAENNSDLVSQYPELKNQDLYIVIDSMNETDNLEVTNYFRQAGYTQEDYAKDTKGMNISEVDIDVPAQFLIPVEYKLAEDGFTVDVLTEEISSESKDYTLAEVHVLPTFGGVIDAKDGYFLVPDGSGGIISFEEEADTNYAAKIYDNDEAVDKQLSMEVTQRTVMPIFGANLVEGGFFSIIEGAAECATVRSQVRGTANLCSAIYASFLLHASDTTNIAEFSGSISMNLYAPEMLTEAPSVRYILLGKGQCDYSSMAKCYQKYLVDKKVLTEKIESGIPLYLDFTGYITEESSVLGIPYDKKVTLSKIEDVDAIIDRLGKDGVTNISVRLKSYSHGGMTNSIMDSFQVDAEVGNVKEIQSLAEKVKKNGGTLYLDDVVDVVYKDSMFDSFDKMTHAGRKINQMLVERGDADIVRRSTVNTLGPRYVTISPIYYQALIDSYINSLEKELEDTNKFGYSWSGYGSRLASDFSKTNYIDRVEARELADEAMERTSGFRSVMTEGGNMYAVARADTILNVPLTDSSYRVVTESVPFYQMVLHGYKNYTGAALNMVTDSETEWLKTIESGAGMYYSCMTEDYTLIKDMNYRQTFYPISEELCHTEMVSHYQSYADVFTKLATQTIQKHEITEEGLRLTTYEDGTVIAVNYEDYAITWGNVTVEARSFAVSQ